MAQNDKYIVKMTEDGQVDNSFVSPAAPAKRRFLTASEVLRKYILKANEETAGVLKDMMEDFTANITSTTGFDLTLKSPHKNRLKLDNALPFTFNAIKLAEVMTGPLGFAASYDESKLEEVQAALPEGLSGAYNEETQVLTVSIVKQETNIDLASDSATLVTAILDQTETFEIHFFDDAIDVAAHLPNRNLTIEVAELVTDLAPAAEGDAQA